MNPVRFVVIPLALGFGVALAVLIGQRLSATALAVIVGVAVGVVSSLPTTLLLITLMRRHLAPPADPSAQPSAYPLPQASQAPYLVLDPAQLLRQVNARPTPQASFGDDWRPLAGQQVGPYAYDDVNGRKP